MKTFYFMSGLPRSGATVLSALLNQNPNFHVPPASPMFRLYVRLANCQNDFENIDYPRDADINNVLCSIPYNFYREVDVKYIIDKNLNWVSPFGIDSISKYINPDIKIICPVRSIIEILASFDKVINSNEKNSNNSLDEHVISTFFPDKPLADLRAEFLMQPNNDIYLGINRMFDIWNSELKHIMHFVEYDDLVLRPKKTLESIYNFLEVPIFKHNFEFIENKFEPKSESVAGIFDLHKIHSKLEKKSIDPSNVLSTETIKRYSGLEFWRDDTCYKKIFDLSNFLNQKHKKI